MNRQGSILIGALMVIGFSLLVGVPLLQAANLEHQASINDQLDAQAFYLAEAGIKHVKAAVESKLKEMLNDDWLPEHGLTHYLNADGTFVTVSREAFGPGDYTASASLTPTESGDGRFEYNADITSDGWVATAVGVKKTNAVALPVVIREFEEGEDPSGGAGPPGGGSSGIDVALFAASEIRMDSQPVINGHVVTNATGGQKVYFGNSTVRINGTLQVGAGGDPDTVIHSEDGKPYTTIITGGIASQSNNRSLPEVEFPAFPNDLPERGEIGAYHWNNPRVLIRDDGWYESIGMNGNSSNHAVLTIEAPAGTTRILRVGSFDFNNYSDLVISGDGNVVIYVEEAIVFRNNLRANVNGRIEQLTIYCDGDYVQFTNNAQFKGSVICRSADFNMNSESCHVEGTLVSLLGDFDVSNGKLGHNVLIYAPQGEVSIVASSVLHGAVICDRFYMTWGCVLNYDEAIKFALGDNEGGRHKVEVSNGDSIWSSER